MARRRRKRIKRRLQSHRLYPLPAWFMSAPWGTCRWCNKPILKDTGEINKRRRWHPSCLHPYLLVTRSNYAKSCVKKRDKGICAKCGVFCRYRNEWQLDHIKPLIEAKGDKTYWELPNLQTLCNSCHSVKTVAENVARRRARKN